MFTIDSISKLLPVVSKIKVKQAFVDKLNSICDDPILAEEMKSNFITYIGVLGGGPNSMEEYLNAVTYVSFRMRGAGVQEAYIKTFPERYQRLVAEGKGDALAGYASMYNRNRLVNAIVEQSIIPSWVLNQHHYQKAINVQVDLMTNAKSETVRMKAADSLLTHLAKPKEVMPLVNIDARGNSGLGDLKDLLVELAAKQKSLITQGTNTVDIANQTIIKEITYNE